jgi:integrase
LFFKINGRKSLRDADLFVKRLKELFGGRRVVDITTPLIQEYILSRQGEGLSNATINRHLSALKRMLNLGARQTPPKVLRMPHVPTPKENNARTGFFEHDEFLALRGALPDYLKAVVTIAYHTGFRREEILSLRWDQVDLDPRRIVLEVGTTKNNEGRVAYMTEDLHRVLEAQKRIRDLKVPGCPPVCFRLTKKGKIRSIGSFRKVWERICKEIGLEGRLLHDFRRTAVRNMVRAGIPERVAMRISGHKTRSVFDRYNIVSESDLQEAVGKPSSFYKVGHNTGTVAELEKTIEVEAVEEVSEKEGDSWSRRSGLNRRPADYESAALPLSYAGR